MSDDDDDIDSLLRELTGVSPLATTERIFYTRDEIEALERRIAELESELQVARRPFWLLRLLKWGKP